MSANISGLRQHQLFYLEITRERDRMKSIQRYHPEILACLLAFGSIALSQQTKASTSPKAPQTLASTLDAQLTIMEKNLVSAAEAMPADKYSFVPKGEDFKGSRTFALELKHVAAANFGFFSEVLGQAPPAGVSFAGATNGPDDVQTKEQIVLFLKDSFALGHKAIATLTEKNALTPVDDPNLPFSQPAFRTRLALASFACTHDADHYGQIVVYLRMNGITPPASKGQPPANPQP
jgi:uncharacterized damage-inducible protein DinB